MVARADQLRVHSQVIGPSLIKEGEESVKISRYGNSPAPSHSFVQQQAPTSVPPVVAVPEIADEPSTVGQSLTSPMVGSYHGRC